MLVRKIAAVVLLMLVGWPCHSQNRPAPMKGYQLFTWKQDGRWHYSLSPATNRQPTFDEITSKAAVVVGTSEFESRLKRLPTGTEVFWQSDAPAGIKRPVSGGMISFKQPSRKRIERVKALCDKLSIKLTLM
ncbi:MAG: hypothetical protein WAU45_17240 [Blastocatellia bacterium]